MRRITHADYTKYRRSPRDWLESKVLPTGGHPVPGYRQAVADSIYRFHRTRSEGIARAYLENRLQRFENEDRIQEAWDTFDSYVGWFANADVDVADVRIGLNASVSSRLHLGGIVSRLDVTGRGYRAILFCSPYPTWLAESRFALIQYAIALRYSRPMDAIDVGVQDLDGSGMVFRSYSLARISAARRSFREFEESVLEEADHVPGATEWLSGP